MTFSTKETEKKRFPAAVLAAIVLAALVLSAVFPAAVPDILPGAVAHAEPEEGEPAETEGETEPVISAPTPSGDVYTAGLSLPGMEGAAGFMMEANTGVVLYDHNGSQRMTPASTTKILTALLVIEHCTDYNEVITFSHESVNNISWDSSKIGAQEGEQMTVDQVLYGLFLKSGNDAAYALAEYVSGSMEAFAELMTQRAAELGCTDSHFANPHGLTDEEHYTTPHDLAVILQECVRHPEFIKYASADYYYIESTNMNPDGYTWYTSNKFLNDSYDTYDPRVIASKTGFTDEAGNCLVTAARDGDTTLLCVVMGCHDTHYSDSARILNYGFDNFTVHSMNGSGTGTYGSAQNGMFGSWRPLIRENALSIEADSAYVLLPKSADVSEVATQIIPETEDPSDDIIATVLYTYGDRTVGQSAIRLNAAGVGSAVRALEQAQGRDLNGDETADAAAGGAEGAGQGDAAGAADSGSAADPAAHGSGIDTKLMVALAVILAALAAVILFLVIRSQRGRKPSRLVYGPDVKKPGDAAGAAADAPKQRRPSAGTDAHSGSAEVRRRRDPNGAPLQGRTVKRENYTHATGTSEAKNARRRTGSQEQMRRQLTPEERQRRAAAREEAQRRAAARTEAERRAREQERDRRQSEARKNARTRAIIEESRKKNDAVNPGGSYENRGRAERTDGGRPVGLNTTSGLSSDLVNERLKRRAELERRRREEE